MQFYYSVETTPLKFHKAFYKVISPILIALNAIFMLASIGWLTGEQNYYSPNILIFSVFLGGLGIVFLAFMSYGFAKQKEYAWYMVYAYLGLLGLRTLVSACSSYSAGFAVGTIIGGSIIPVLIGIYYYKRKPLFVTSGVENVSFPQSNGTAVPRDISRPTATPPFVRTTETVSFCRKCGNRVPKDSVFCNKCGSKINWN